MLREGRLGRPGAHHRRRRVPRLRQLEGAGARCSSSRGSASPTRPGYRRCEAADAMDASSSSRASPCPFPRSEIREKIARGEPIDGLVPPGVAAAIADEGLYRGYTDARSRFGDLTDTTRARTSYRRSRPGEAGQGRRHPGHDPGVHLHRLLRDRHGPEPAADEGDLRRGARGAEGRRPRRCRPPPTGRGRRRGSSPTTSTSCCTCSRPRRGSSTTSRICGATCRRSSSRPSRPSSEGLTPKGSDPTGRGARCLREHP